MMVVGMTVGFLEEVAPELSKHVGSYASQRAVCEMVQWQKRMYPVLRDYKYKVVIETKILAKGDPVGLYLPT